MIEQKIEELQAAIHELTESVRANTAALLGVPAKHTTSAKPAAGSAAPAAAGKRGPGRPPKAKPEDGEDLGGEESGDGLGDGLGDELGDGLGDLGGREPQYAYADLLNLMLSLRDIGGKSANKEDCRKVIKKLGIENFKELDGQEEKYDATAKYIKELAAKRKVTL
jgi:hypothetical protein